jgi:hypothetical protein
LSDLNVCLISPFYVPCGQIPLITNINSRNALLTITERQYASRFNTEIRPLKNPSIPGLLSGISFNQFQLAFACVPQSVGGVLETCGSFKEDISERSDETGRNGSQRRRGNVEKPSEVPDADNRHMVGGAFFVIGIGIVLAILCIGWNQPNHPCPQQKKHKTDGNKAN